jgi:hypothetical protein
MQRASWQNVVCFAENNLSILGAAKTYPFPQWSSLDSVYPCLINEHREICDVSIEDM